MDGTGVRLPFCFNASIAVMPKPGIVGIKCYEVFTDLFVQLQHKCFLQNCSQYVKPHFPLVNLPQLNWFQQISVEEGDNVHRTINFLATTMKLWVILMCLHKCQHVQMFYTLLEQWWSRLMASSFMHQASRKLHHVTHFQ